METGSTITSVRYCIGLFSAIPVATADCATGHVAAFVYDSTADGTVFWRAVTRDNATSNIQATSQAIAASTAYWMRIRCDSTDCRFWINGGAPLITTSTNLPGSTTYLSMYETVTNLANSARVIAVGNHTIRTR